MIAMHITQKWIREEDATAAAEFALIFPIMFMMMLAMWDLGNGILANQKAIAASQMVADLIGRQFQIDDTQIAQALQAGELAMMPYDTDGGILEIEVVSVAFDENDDPEVRWSETLSGDDADEADLAPRTAGLGLDGEGAIVVRVSYDYEPTFSYGSFLDTINMREYAFSRGRRTGIVGRI